MVNASKTPDPSRKRQKGALMAGVVAMLAISLIWSAVAFQAWIDVLRRDNEAEMIFRGKEIARAIQRYRMDHQNQGPPELKDLMEPAPNRGNYYLHTLYDVEGGGFVREVGTNYPVDRGLTGRVIQSGVAIRIDDFGGTSGIRTKVEESVSALIVPLRVDEQVIGTLNLGAAASATYTDEDLELAVLLARQIETSLYYSKLLATIQMQREALAVEHERVASERTRLEALIEASNAAILMVSGDRVAHANQAMAERSCPASPIRAFCSPVSHRTTPTKKCRPPIPVRN